MNKRKLAGATALSLALPGIVASLSVMPAANLAVIPAANAIEAEDTNDTDSSFDTMSSSATMEQQCKWVLLGAPSSIAFSPEDSDAEYDGTELVLSYDSVSDISVHSTGNLDTNPSYGSYQDCAFFENVFSPKATLTLDTTLFAAKVNSEVDTGMDFNISGSNPLDFSYNPNDTDCTGWATAVDTGFELTSALSESTILDLETSSADDVKNPVNSSNGNDKCMLTSDAVKVSIPAGKNPSEPGQPYDFDGPTLTTALSTRDLGGS